MAWLMVSQGKWCRVEDGMSGRIAVRRAEGTERPERLRVPRPWRPGRTGPWAARLRRRCAAAGIHASVLRPLHWAHHARISMASVGHLLWGGASLCAA